MTINYTHQFIILRDNEQEEPVEITLEAEFDIEPFVQGKYFGSPEYCYPDEGGVAYIKDKIFIIHDDGKKEVWTDHLSANEREAAEDDAYLNWTKDYDA